MKLFTTKQIAEIDRFTIENEPVAGIELMERAARQVTDWLVSRFPGKGEVVLFAGPGNNGGDALAVGRQLAESGFSCEVYLCTFGKEPSGSLLVNLNRLKEQSKVKLSFLEKIEDFIGVAVDALIVDGLFGSGLTRGLRGFPARLVEKINEQENIIVSIDIPSGLMGEDNSAEYPSPVIRAGYTLTFQFPKISFFFAENEKYVGRFEVLPIGLHPEGINRTATPYFLTDREMAGRMLPVRQRFAHKGDFGHALLIAGSYGKMGAAVLASRACLRTGAGLLTSHIPGLGYPVLQSTVPEAMVSVDRNPEMFSECPDLSPFSFAGAGPGLGKKDATCRALLGLLEKSVNPLVLDADALNILSENRDWIRKIPPYSILTPHPGEFRRLAGESPGSFARLQKQIAFSRDFNLVVVLKGAYSTITIPDGRVYFNPTGNPGLATAGSGDVLTGIILGLLSQGISPEDSAILGVYIHGLAGDMAAADKSEPAVIAGDIVDYLGKAFLKLFPCKPD